jgi:hypothetical protein
MTDNFYLGRQFDLRAGKASPDALHYDPTDLTTHAIITGMTGSGKTGLCLALMEEAALQGIPAILIDPKGDLTNLLLHFPNLAPQDFQPWLDADTIRRQGKAVEQVAAETAQTWRNGLAEWGITQERLLALQNAAKFGVYTPGSDAGLQVSVLSSLEAPPIPWEGNKEILRERISSTVTALLGLVGYEDVDPLRSREHILIANIFESAWSQGKSLDMTELIMQVQNPPFQKLGAFPVENFFPEKDRTLLAMTLNNILASPAFQSWREGQPLDVRAMLFTDDGQPRHSVFYIAHLSEGERMFFVTLLLSAVETWMRTQAGSTSLRALLYFDEIFGYLPPQRNPPSKIPLLRMLKQARAFGVGLVLATQNPVDVDYKALSNAGTWFVGKLQTERDRERLLDGLQTATADLDRSAYGQIISALGKRVFLLHNVHAHQPVIFQSRWVMNFLAGPLTRAQIPALNQLAGAFRPLKQAEDMGSAVSFGLDAAPMAAATPQGGTPDLSRFQSFTANGTIPGDESPNLVNPASLQRDVTNRSTVTELEGSLTKPNLPGGIAEYFLPVNYSVPEAFHAAGEPMAVDARMEAILYRPTLLASARVRVLDRRYGVDSELHRAALVDVLERRGVVRWDDFPYAGPDLSKLDRQPAPQARFATLDAPFADSKLISTLQKDFADWAFRTSSVTARANEHLKVYAGPDVSAAEFRKACSETARAMRDTEIAKTAAALDRQIATLREKLAREQRELTQDQVEYEHRKREETGNMLELGAGLLGLGRKKNLTTQLSKNRLTQQARAEVDESIVAIKQFEAQVAEKEAEREQVVREINDRWADLVNDVTEIAVAPKKADVFIEIFGVAWQPFYVVSANGERYELPGFGAE